MTAALGHAAVRRVAPSDREQAWLGDARYLLSAGGVPVLALVVSAMAWRAGFDPFGVFWARVTLVVPVLSGSLPASWVAAGVAGIAVVVAFLAFARSWAPGVHERTARHLGRARPPALPTLSGGPRARFVGLVAGADSWRRAFWCLTSLALCAAAFIPLFGFADGLRGLAWWQNDNYTLYVVHWFGPKRLDVHLHESLTAWIAVSAAEVAAGLGWPVLAMTWLARLHADVTTTMLQPDPTAVDNARLAARVDDLTRTRAGAVDAHSGELRRIERDHAEVEVTRTGDTLHVRVSDDGLGGVDESRGTGVSGMRRRVEVLDGWLDVRSTVGGPTIVQAEIPCAS